MKKKDIHELAMRAAHKICNCDVCFAPFACERKDWHTNQKNFRAVRPVGKDTVCRLKAYDVRKEENKKPFWERNREEYETSYDELNAVCAECPHAVLNGNQIEISNDAFIEHCLDCPIHQSRESMQEAAAEAAMS